MFGERGRAIDLVRQKNDEVQLPAGIRNRDCRIIRSLRVTDALKSFVHHRHVDRRGALDMERLRFRRFFFKWIRPRRLEIERICQHHARGFVECASRNQILDAFARLLRYPIVDVNSGFLEIVSKVDRLECGAVIIFR